MGYLQEEENARISQGSFDFSNLFPAKWLWKKHNNFGVGQTQVQIPSLPLTGLGQLLDLFELPFFICKMEIKTCLTGFL